MCCGVPGGLRGGCRGKMSGRDCVCDGVMLGKTSLEETFSIRHCLAAEMGGGDAFL